MDLTYIYTHVGLPRPARPTDASLSEWTAYLDDPADLWQNLLGAPVLQTGLQPELQMSNSL